MILLAWVSLAPSSADAGVRYTLPVAVFSYEHYPAEPREDYLAGELGIVLPGFSRSYLYVAHRWMDGSPLTFEEQQEIRKIWFRVPEPPLNQENAWEDLRSTVREPVSESVRDLDWRSAPLTTRGYLQFRPCTPHGFERAANRLREHIDLFGVESAEVRAWARAQDAVFHHCSLPGDTVFPGPAPADVHPVIREDRAYQIAAARFNAAQFAEAERAFRQIEPPPQSWAGLWAPYMVGRSIVWQSRMFLGDDEGYRALLRKAQVALEAVLRRDDLAETHDAARHLLIRVLALTDQEAAARLLGLRLSSPLRAGSRVQDWEQYSSLLFHNTRQIEDYRPTLKPHGELRKLGVRDALTDWILTFQSQDEAAYEHALRRWRETGSTAWLVACLSKATAESAAAPRLLEAAAQLPPGPAWASVQFYSARLLAARAEREQARVVLDRLLPQIASRSSSWNRALALRAELGRTVRETLQFGIRRPASFAVLPSAGGPSAPWEWNAWDARHLGRILRYEPMLTPVAADILNSAVPLTRFAALIAEDHGLPEPIRRDIVIAAWVRAVLLEKIDLAFNLAAEVAKVAEETDADMARYRASKPADRRFVAVAILLKFPGMSVRLYPGIGRAAPLEELHLSGFNWWWWTLCGEIEPTPPEAAAVDWLTASESAEAKREWAQIVALGNGASWLYKTTYERCRAASPPSDCAEALYRTVVSRDWVDYPHGLQYVPYGIYDIAGYESSELLRRRFARTRWAQLVEKDGADGVNAWKHEYLPFRLSAPYPR